MGFTNDELKAIEKALFRRVLHCDELQVKAAKDGEYQVAAEWSKEKQFNERLLGKVTSEYVVNKNNGLGSYDGSCWKTAEHRYKTTWLGSTLQQELYWVSKVKMNHYIEQQTGLGYAVNVEILKEV